MLIPGILGYHIIRQLLVRTYRDDNVLLQEKGMKGEPGDIIFGPVSDQ